MNLNFLKSRLRLGGLAVLTWLSACGQGGQMSQTKKLIGQDDRTSLLREDPLRELIGTLNFGTHVFCSAYASADDEITTARHCVSDEIAFERIKFVNGFGKEFDISSISRTDDPHIVRLKLASALGNRLETSTADPSRPVRLVSYSETHTDYVSGVGSFIVADFPADVLSHDVDSEPGSSGAPLLQDGKVVAVHIGASTAGGNLAAQAVFPSHADRAQEIEEGTPPQSTVIPDFQPEWKCKSKCKWYQPDCYAWKELNCRNSVISLCGRNLTVPALLYAACQASVAAIPVTCTAGSALTAGTSCAANIGVSAAACGVSIESLWRIGQACVGL